MQNGKRELSPTTARHAHCTHECPYHTVKENATATAAATADTSGSHAPSPELFSQTCEPLVVMSRAAPVPCTWPLALTGLEVSDPGIIHSSCRAPSPRYAPGRFPGKEGTPYRCPLSGHVTLAVCLSVCLSFCVCPLSMSALAVDQRGGRRVQKES